MKESFRSHTLLVVFVFLVFALAVAGCGGQAEEGANAPQEPLVILEWSGYELPEFRPQFVEKYPELDPQYTFFAEDAEGFAKLQSGFEFDLSHPCINFWQLYVDNGLVQPIDTSRIVNWDKVYPELAKIGEFDGKQYFVPYDWGYESIVVRTDKVQNLPTSWADLWKPEYAGHIALYDSGESNHIITALALGLDPWNVTAEQNDQITAKLLELKPNVLTYWTDYSMAIQLVSSGDVWMATNTWNDAYTTLLGEGVPVEYINPSEGRLGWMCGYGISANSDNVDMAYDFINAMLDPESHAVFGNTYSYGVSTSAAVALMDQEIVNLMKIGDPEVLNSTIFYKPLSEELRQVVTSRWTELKAAP